MNDRQFISDLTEALTARIEALDIALNMLGSPTTLEELQECNVTQVYIDAYSGVLSILKAYYTKNEGNN